MTRFTVEYETKAQAQFSERYQYIADVSGPKAAEDLIGDIRKFCDGLDVFPKRGTPRDDLYPGLRVTTYAHKSRKASIAYLVRPDTGRVIIVGIFFGGQSMEKFFGEPSEEI